VVPLRHARRPDRSSLSWNDNTGARANVDLDDISLADDRGNPTKVVLKTRAVAGTARLLLELPL